MVVGRKSQGRGGYDTSGKGSARRWGGGRSGQARRHHADRECRRLERKVRRAGKAECRAGLQDYRGE